MNPNCPQERNRLDLSSSEAVLDVTTELLRRQWVLERSSDRASLWVLPEKKAELYVPNRLERNTLEWKGVLDRIAAPTNERPRDIERSLELKNYDSMRFSVNAIGTTIPLESAATVIGSAFGMIRAAATTARRPTQSIKSYSKAGDEIVKRAKLSHTEIGSFVFPVLLRIEKPAPLEQEPLEGIEEVAPESEERRVTRTLSQALDALWRNVVAPGTEPTTSSLLPVIYAGGTKEMLVKVAATLAEPEISFLETRFDWASAEVAGENLPSSVEIPAEAHDLVTEAARILGNATQDPLRVLVGPVIRIEHIKGEAFGEIAIQAAGSESGRRSRVEMRVRAQMLGPIHDWMHRGTTVLVQGRVKTRTGRYSFLEEIVDPQPLSSTLDGL